METTNTLILVVPPNCLSAVTTTLSEFYYHFNKVYTFQCEVLESCFTVLTVNVDEDGYSALRKMLNSKILLKCRVGVVKFKSYKLGNISSELFESFEYNELSQAQEEYLESILPPYTLSLVDNNYIEKHFMLIAQYCKEYSFIARKFHSKFPVPKKKSFLQQVFSVFY